MTSDFKTLFYEWKHLQARVGMLAAYVQNEPSEEQPIQANIGEQFKENTREIYKEFRELARRTLETLEEAT